MYLNGLHFQYWCSKSLPFASIIYRAFKCGLRNTQSLPCNSDTTTIYEWLKIYYWYIYNFKAKKYLQVRYYQIKFRKSYWLKEYIYIPNVAIAILKPIPKSPSIFSFDTVQSSNVKLHVDVPFIPNLSSFAPKLKPTENIKKLCNSIY